METRFFEPGTVPEWTTPDWYAQRERAPHLEQDGHRGRLLLSAEYVWHARSEHRLRTVSDLGCGDGGLLSLIGAPAWGYDLMPENIAGAAERGVDARLGDFMNEPVEWGDITVCTEVLEHLIDPHAFVASIPSQVLVASSPDGETWEQRYEFHTWGWDMPGYRALFEQGGYRVVRHESIGFQVLMGVRA